MKVLITGANGFIGKNLRERLQKVDRSIVVYYFDIETPKEKLEEFTKDCDFVYNFAAVHRPKDDGEFDVVNHLFFRGILDLLKKHNNNCPVLYTSSIQAGSDTKYGQSKVAAENELIRYGQQTGNRIIIYRLTNTFGKWAMPNHHSVVATFCYNLVKGLPLTISNPDIQMKFYYIDDVIDSFVAQLQSPMEPDADGFFRLDASKVYSITLGQLADTLTRISEAVKTNREFIAVTPIEERLYTTYLSYHNEL